MLHKAARPQKFKLLKKVGVGLVLAETAAFFVSYLGWNKLNSDREFRYYMRENYPPILELYYTLGEKLSTSNIRAIDNSYWEVQEK